VLNNLYKHTPLQTVFGINMVALVDGQPKLLNLKEILEAFLRHRREVVTRARSSSCARRASAPMSSRAWPWRWPTSTRSSR
jgi:DNA gyrase/topoisomerase IV subunit A